MKGVSYTLGLRSKTPFDKSWEPVLGEYAFADNNAGIFPLFVSVMQSNFMGGIERLQLSKEGERLFITSKEGGKEYRFEAGLYEFKTTVMSFGGESYLLSCMAEAIEDEDRNPIYKLELIFPELPNSRMIKLSLSGGRLIVRMSEAPNERIATTYISSMTSSPKVAIVMGMLDKKLGSDFIQRKLTAIFNPTLSGINIQKAGFETILASEAKVAEELRDNSNKLLSAIVSRFVGDDKSDTPEEEQRREPGILKRAILGIFAKRPTSDSIIEVEAEPARGEATEQKSSRAALTEDEEE